MNECGVCGILYLAGGSCPACGSQIQKRSDDFQDADIVLPSEVPGLDEAADAWYDLEGIEKPIDEFEEELPSSSLPFGFGGESTTNVSRLPFGIGSHRDGIPFDVENNPSSVESIEAVVEVPEEHVEEEINPSSDVATDHQTSLESVEQVEIVLPSIPTLPDVNPPVDNTPMKLEPIRIKAIALNPEPIEQVVQPDIPIDVEAETEIYSIEDDVVEVVFSDLEDTIVHVEHGVEDTFNQPQVVEYAEKTFTPFDLHPARAMTVQASNNAQVKGLVEDGFLAIGRGDWRTAARSFQRVLASVPQDVGAMNNYGISLLQVATSMQESNDPVDVSNSATQFEAAILSLREAVRNKPDGAESLYNLAQALYLSGREEKALGLLGMADASIKSEADFVNLQAAILAQLGQYGEAKSMLAPHQAESLISKNLLKLPSL
jgi:tetratricopeptide (TPR) repeat protein